MLAFVARRLLATIPIMGLVAIFVFLLLHMAPGDPAVIIAGDFASEADIERIRERLGLDQPLYLQFLTWLRGVLQGDFGVSIYSGLPVSRLIAERLEPTAALTFTTMLIAVSLAIPMGIIAAWRMGSWIDHLVMGFAVMGFSMPVFVLAYLLIFLFSLQLGVLPVQGYRSISDGLTPFLRHIALPSITLGVVFMALIARMTRTAMLEVLNEDYIRTAHAKGLLPRDVLRRHALKNAAVPVVTTIGLGFALLIGGVVITESVFAIPGLGRLTVDAVLRKDYPIIQGVILVFSFAYVLLNLLVDLSYAFFDPRIVY
ncbi:MAG: ABC transporter permease [Deinococcota bacterium]|jgi:peptide/nickel transport system permease protein|nr:ABC transporter permease [Deinococcota bacterium]